MNAALQEFWAGRTPRERALLGVAGALAALAVVLLLIVRPALGWRGEAAQKAAARETEFRLVADAARLAASGPAAADAATPARAAVNAAAVEAGVEFSFVNNREDGAVEAQVNSVAPEKLFAMLSALERRYGVRPSAIDVARVADGAAEVRVQMTLSR